MQSSFFTEESQNSHVWSIGALSARSPRAWALLVTGLGLLLGGSSAAVAQSLPSVNLPKSSDAKQEQPPQKSQQGKLETTFGILSHRSVFFPELAHQPGALTKAQKLELAADISVAPSRFLSSAVTAAIDQARNAIPGYGQGWGAYGKRFGSSLATTASANVFGTFVLASALHQDPRYFVKVNGTFKQKNRQCF
jgi:hypothetical protein